MQYKHYLLGLIVALLLCSGTLEAQETYKHGLGLRLGSSYGITYKTFFKEKLAFEGILSTRYYGEYRGNNGWGNNNYNYRYSRSGGMLTGLIEYHIPIPELPELSIYFGGGVHLIFWRGEWYDPNYYEDRTYLFAGIDAIIGAEYVFKELPIALALDFKPSFHFAPHDNFWPDEAALSVRFLLDRL
jgi:hypothetical protein